jgi:hypothetical protein
MGLLRNGPQAQKTRPVESAGLSSDRGVSFGPSAIGKRLFPRAKALIFVRTLKNPDSGAAFEFGSGLL